MSKPSVYNIWVASMYLGFHNIVLNHFGYLCDKTEAFIFDNDMLYYTFLIHSFHFGCWIALNTFITFKNDQASIFVLPYMALYNNLHNYFKHRSNMSFEYYHINQGALWMFTSPYILSIYSDMNNLNMRGEVTREVFLHITNTVYNIYNIHVSEFTIVKLCLIIVMYLLYAYNLYSFNKHNTSYKHILLYSWIVIGLNESMFLMKLIGNEAYTLFTLVNDVHVKSILFGVTALRKIEMASITNKLSLADLQKLYAFQAYLEKEKNKYTDNMSNEINTILSNIDMSTIRRTLSDRVICKDFTDSFMKTLIKKNKYIKNVVIMFSDVVNYSRMSKDEDSCNIVEKLQELYEAYDDVLTEFQNLQKVENIGDCYMVTSLMDKTHCRKNRNVCSEAITFAIKLIDTTLLLGIHTRVGIHIGNVSLGIIGKDVPRFGVVGHNVNVAARLESTCETDKIQVSKQFKDALDKEGFDTSIFKSSMVELKNIGKYQTFTFDPNIVNGYCDLSAV